MKERKFKLCYVNESFMFFTDNFEKQWGDDWNDAPYEHNAGYPYDLKEDEPVCDGHGHIRYIAYISDYPNYVNTPAEKGYYNSPWSVEDINKGAVAWLFSNEAGGLMAGATMDEAIEWCKKAKIMWGELKYA